MEQRPKHRRKQLIVYPRLQWTILAYVTVGIMVSVFIVFRISRLINVDTMSYEVSKPALAAIVIAMLGITSGWLVLGIYMTNRMFGPVFRLHKEIRAWRSGGVGGHPIILRTGDHFGDLIGDFNELVKERLEPAGRERKP